MTIPCCVEGFPLQRSGCRVIIRHGFTLHIPKCSIIQLSRILIKIFLLQHTFEEACVVLELSLPANPNQSVVVSVTVR